MVALKASYEGPNTQDSEIQQPSLAEVKPSLLDRIVPGLSQGHLTITYALINIAVYIVTSNLYDYNWHEHYYTWDCYLYFWGANFSYAVTRQFQLYRLVSALFLTYSGFILAWSTLALLMFGC